MSLSSLLRIGAVGRDRPSHPSAEVLIAEARHYREVLGWSVFPLVHVEQYEVLEECDLVRGVRR